MKSISTKLILVFTLALGISAGLLYFLVMLPAIEKQTKTGLKSKTQSITETSKPSIEKAMKTSDDIMLLSTIETLSKAEDVTSCFIIDSQGKVLTHNNTNEWGKIYSDEIYTKAIKGETGSFYNTAKPEGYLYATHLISSSTLCVMVSFEKINAVLSAYKKNSMISFLTVIIVSTIIFAVIVIIILNKRINLLENSINSSIAGTIDKIELAGNDEFSIISDLINKLASKNNNKCETPVNIYTYIIETAKNIEKPVLFLNNDNKVFYVNEKAIAITGNILNKHIMDLSDELLSGYKESLKQPSKTIRTKSAGITSFTNQQNKPDLTIITF